MNPGARYAPGPVLQQLTAPAPGVCYALHKASALTEQLTDEVLDLALEPLRVLYLQTHIPPAGTSNRLGCLGLQRRVVEQWLTLHNPSTAQGHWYLHQLLFLPRAAPEHCDRTGTTRTRSARACRASRSRHCPPSHQGRARRRCNSAPRSTRPPRYSKGEATTRTGPSRTARTAERWPGRRPAGTSPGTPRGLGSTGQRTARRWRPWSRPSPWDPGRRGQHNCCPKSPAETRGPASQPLRTRRQHPSRRSSGTSSRQCYWQTAERVLSTTTAQRRSREADKVRSAVARHTPRAHPRQGRGWRCTPSGASAGGSAGAAGGGLPGHPARPRRGVPVAHPGRGPLDCLARHRQAGRIPATAPCRLAAGAHPGLLYDGGPLAASSPATHRQRPQQEAGTGVGKPPCTGLEP